MIEYRICENPNKVFKIQRKRWGVWWDITATGEICVLKLFHSFEDAAKEITELQSIEAAKHKGKYWKVIWATHPPEDEFDGTEYYR